MRFLLVEAKEDIQKFVDKFGQENYDKFVKNKQRIKSMNPGNNKLVDMTWHVKNSSINDVEDLLNKAESRQLDIEGKPIPEPTNSKKLIYNKNGTRVYIVYDVGDMIDLGKNTEWCIAGRSDIPNGQIKVSQAEYYFNEYKNRSNIQYYYVIIDRKEKYCILKKSDGEINSIWNKEDYKISEEEFSSSVNLDKDFLENEFGIINWSNIVYYWDGESRVPENVVNVVIEDGINIIGNSSFANCHSLTNITIPDSVTSIGMSAFINCTSLTNIKIPNSVKSIGGGSFAGCDNLTNIEIPNSVTSIGYAAFVSCHRLTNIEIPDSVARIDADAFVGCDNLIIICNHNSYAEKYAKENDIPVKYID